jgi:DNA-binding NarL/FixJ family response regulator
MAGKSNAGAAPKMHKRRREMAVLIATANVSLREKWITGLQARFPIHAVSGQRELKDAMAMKPAILLIDSELPEVDVLKELPSFLRLSPSTGVIVFNKNPNDQAMGLVKAGAKGVCHTDIDLSLLSKAIRVVQKGEIWVGRKTVSRLLEELASEIERRRLPYPFSKDH